MTDSEFHAKACSMAGSVCFDMDLPASSELWDIVYKRAVQYFCPLKDEAREYAALGRDSSVQTRTTDTNNK